MKAIVSSCLCCNLISFVYLKEQHTGFPKIYYLLNYDKYNTSQMNNGFLFRRVMTVDDEDINRLLVKRMVQRHHFAEEVISCESGSEALNYLNEHPFALPDLIFLDVNMPEMDGFEFLEKYDKLNEKVKATCAIIMLTVSLYVDVKERANNNQHVKLFLTKPLIDSQLDLIRFALL